MSVSNEHLSFPCVDSGVWRPKMRQKKLPLSLSLPPSHSWKKDATNHVRISICTKYITTTTTKKPHEKIKWVFINTKNQLIIIIIMIIISFKGL
jgi:hypothetical protein